MPKTIAAASVAVATALVVAATAAAQLPSKVAKDPLDRFTISVPSAWSVQTSAASRAPAVTAKAPTSTGGLPDSVYVITQDLGLPVSAQGCLVEADRVMKFGIHNWKTISEEPTTLAGLPAYSRTYTWTANTGQSRRSVQTCVTLGRRAYMVVATTANTAAAEQQNLPMLEQIMSTFRPNKTNLPASGPQQHEGGGR